MPDHQRLVHLRAAREHRRDERDADAAAEIAHEIIETVALPICCWSRHRRRQRHENKTDRDPVYDLTTSIWLTCRLMLLNMNDDVASAIKPKQTLQRIGIFPDDTRPTTSVVAKAAMPRGLKA